MFNISIAKKTNYCDTDLTWLAFVGASLSEVEQVLEDIGESTKSSEESMSPESTELVAMELGKTIKITGISKGLEDSAEKHPKPAVITVMGHVDHGKTSLLDALRNTSVAAREAGGITQHVGAFEVALPESGKSLTFLDTPGHAAFTAMRARGAAITDIVVLVVAADDGVMPQTKEAFAHVKVSKCPLVVAITKCDLEGANPDRVRAQLGELGIELEQYGGNVQSIEMAATQGIGLKDLETALLLEAEMLELQAAYDVPASGTVIESRIDKGQGPVAMVIITRGTLRPGESIVIGDEWGKVRLLKDPVGRVIGKEGVSPGRPVEVIGLKGTPNSGDELLVVASDDRAQKISKARKFRSENIKAGIAAEEKWKMAQADQKSTDDGEELEENGPTTIPIILKADVHGSVEAIKESLSGVSNDSVTVDIIHTGVGPVTGSDVDLAVPFGGSIIGFNVKVASDAEASAKRHGIKVSSRRIIYDIIQDVEALVDGATPKPPQEVIIGTAEVLALFKVPGRKGNPERMVAGCKVLDGKLKSGMKLRVLRSGEVVHEAPIQSLRRHRLDVDTVGKGTECGVGLLDWEGFMLGDSLSCLDYQ